MDVTFATEPTPGRVNEDHVAASGSYVVVLDGVTVPAGVRTGCVHDVPWLVRNLGELLMAGLSGDDRVPLADVLAGAIAGLCDRHRDTCHLAARDSPSATVALLRVAGDRLDYLVLCDSYVVIDEVAGLRVVHDDRTARLPAYDAVSVARLRNAPGGFWVASTDPRAAEHALTGSVAMRDVRRAAVLSDGAARLVERFGGTWEQVLQLAGEAGPRAVIEAVRHREHSDDAGRSRGKRFDDATLAYCVFPPA
ncbi:hypothetical protein PSN13_01423 [Micromonospora saelicesensis]|uniref:PPM-type phosphatase domain-containing protein n=1 Tax=Micromonospora saelicesensis TaxID=285676 RepID=A0A328NYD6_9ACTN|nr:hypothetical protein PSN13_01423 [Micromonospora saelicesensis]